MSCSSDRSPSRQSSSSGDLLPEMMESETPPPLSPPHDLRSNGESAAMGMISAPANDADGESDDGVRVALLKINIQH